MVFQNTKLRYPSVLPVLSIVVLILAAVPLGCSDSEPYTAKSSGLKPVDDDGAAGKPTDGDAAGPAGSDVDGTREGNGTKPAGGDDNASGRRDPFLQNPIVPPDTEDPFEVPEDATPRQLMALIEKLDGRRAHGVTYEEQKQDVILAMQARLTAAERILAADGLDEQLRADAVRAMFYSLRMLANLSDKKERAKLRDCALALENDKNPKVALLSRMEVFQLLLEPLVRPPGVAKPDVTDEAEKADEVMERLQALVTDEHADKDVFQLTQMAPVALLQAGHPDKAVLAARMIGNAFTDSENKEVAATAVSLLQLAESLEIQVLGQALVGGDDTAKEPMLEKTKTLLGAEGLNPLVFDMTMGLAQTLEYAGHVEPASEVFGLIGEAFKDHENPKLVEQAARSVEMAKKRLALVGEPLSVEGVLIDGETFDWNNYKGKVVLVDFWATWCGPCVREIPNIKRNYELYRSRGFEVVGVNLDEDRSKVERFFAAGKLPWVTVFCNDPEAAGFDDPNAERCGVAAIPFLVLVGKDGNVVALHVRGELLGEKLQELLGDPAEGPVDVEGPDGLDTSESAAPTGDTADP